MFIVSDQICIPAEEFRFSFCRSSGPGGQNVNKVNTKATLHWDVTKTPSLPAEVRARFIATYGRRINTEGQVVIVSQRHRDQGRNRIDCLKKLSGMILAVSQTPKRRRRTRPTRASRERRLRAKRCKAEKKQLRRDPRQ